MVQRDRDLDQSLHELLVRLGCGAPYVFECLVGLKKGGMVEQFNPLAILFEIHVTLWHKQPSLTLNKYAKSVRLEVEQNQLVGVFE